MRRILLGAILRLVLATRIYQLLPRLRRPSLPVRGVQGRSTLVPEPG